MGKWGSKRDGKCPNCPLGVFVDISKCVHRGRVVRRAPGLPQSVGVVRYPARRNELTCIAVDFH